MFLSYISMPMCNGRGHWCPRFKINLNQCSSVGGRRWGPELRLRNGVIRPALRASAYHPPPPRNGRPFAWRRRRRSHLRRRPFAWRHRNRWLRHCSRGRGGGRFLAVRLLGRQGRCVPGTKNMLWVGQDTGRGDLRKGELPRAVLRERLL